MLITEVTMTSDKHIAMLVTSMKLHCTDAIVSMKKAKGFL
jgi:ribosome-binding factor A